MIDEIETELEADEIIAPPKFVSPHGESVFMFSATRCPPSGYATKALMELLFYFAPQIIEPHESLIQADGTPVAGWEARTALWHLQQILGPIHPSVRDACHHLREELKR